VVRRGRTGRRVTAKGPPHIVVRRPQDGSARVRSPGPGVAYFLPHVDAAAAAVMAPFCTSVIVPADRSAFADFVTALT
jgi:hypothetical protein